MLIVSRIFLSHSSANNATGHRNPELEVAKAGTIYFSTSIPSADEGPSAVAGT